MTEINIKMVQVHDHKKKKHGIDADSTFHNDKRFRET